MINAAVIRTMAIMLTQAMMLIAFVEVFIHRYVIALFPDKPWVGQLQDIYVFGILILVLLFKPSGLLGKTTVEKV